MWQEFVTEHLAITPLLADVTTLGVVCHGLQSLGVTGGGLGWVPTREGTVLWQS